MKVIKIPIANRDITKIIQPLFYKFDNSHLLLRFLICNNKVKPDYRFRTPLTKKKSPPSTALSVIPPLPLSIASDKEEIKKLQDRIIDKIVSTNSSNNNESGNETKDHQHSTPDEFTETDTGPNIDIIEPFVDEVIPPPMSFATNTIETDVVDPVEIPPERYEHHDVQDHVKESLFKDADSDFIVDLTEREELKAQLELLKTITNIPFYTETTSTENLRHIVRVTRKQCLIKERTESIRNYIKTFLICLEFVCTQFLSINLSGFAAKEFDRFDNYNSYVMDLSNRSYLKPSGPVEMRLLKDIIVNAVGYHGGAGNMSSTNTSAPILKKLSKFIGKKK